jgi:DNA invertase Pin-like site-specific DNA recombinase
MGKRVILYTRVSTQDQDPDVQLHRLREYSGHRGFRIVAELEDRVSGSKEKRPSLDELWRLVRGRKADVVLVWRFDRFARSTRQLVNALEEMEALGVDFISHSENIDTTTPAGKALFVMVSAFAEFERSLISERVKAGLAKARANGKRFGRPVVPQRMVTKIQDLRGKGLSLGVISKQLSVPRSTVAKYAVLKSG